MLSVCPCVDVGFDVPHLFLSLARKQSNECCVVLFGKGRKNGRHTVRTFVLSCVCVWGGVVVKQ